VEGNDLAECVCAAAAGYKQTPPPSHTLRARPIARAKQQLVHSAAWPVISLNCAPHFFSLQQSSNGTREESQERGEEWCLDCDPR
jgi:hypothetical protein